MFDCLFRKCRSDAYTLSNDESTSKRHMVSVQPKTTTEKPPTTTTVTNNGNSTVRDEIDSKKSSLDISDKEEPDGEVRRRSGVQVTPATYQDNEDATLPQYPKSPEDEALIRKAIENNDFLNKIISGKRLQDIISAMYSKEVEAKEYIIKQGETGSHMYVSYLGKYQVTVKGKGVVQEFDDTRIFGELAILYNAKRLASVRAVNPGKVWVLDRSVYQQITLRSNIEEQDELLNFLKSNEKLSAIGEEALQEVANLLKSEFFTTGTKIVKQGDKGDKFYIIRAGTVTISKTGEGDVGSLSKGKCFGELALQKEDCRQATVTADPPGVECLTLTRQEFQNHFGDVQFTNIKVEPTLAINEIEAEYQDLELSDLKIMKTLGVGGFGRVELVQHKKKKNMVFALKYLKKIDIILQRQQEHVYNEKDIQMACRSPFIVRLYRTYKDSKYIYMLMESCLGGDLFSLLHKQRNKRFEEKDAKFIAACVIESFDYLHSRGIVYRDLKPENLLIDKKGYIKLTDFGFAKKMTTRGRTFTFAGTPEYVAPEIILNKGHDKAVDYWAYGAFVFELLTGRTPFRTDDSSHMKTYNRILSGIDNVRFPQYVNVRAKQLIEKLCRPVPADRLGMQKGGIKDVKNHKWFSGFDWLQFVKCELQSPFRPKLNNEVDTQYFDQFKQDKDIPPDELSGWDANF